MKMVAKSSIGTTVVRQSAWWLKASRGDFLYLDRVLNGQTQKRGPFPRKGYEIKSYPIRGNGPLFVFRQNWQWIRNVSVYGKVSRYGVDLSRKADFIPYCGKGNVENGGQVFHTHYNGQSESVVVKSESKRFLIIWIEFKSSKRKKGVVSPAIDMT